MSVWFSIISLNFWLKLLNFQLKSLNFTENFEFLLEIFFKIFNLKLLSCLVFNFYLNRVGTKIGKSEKTMEFR